MLLKSWLFSKQFDWFQSGEDQNQIFLKTIVFDINSNYGLNQQIMPYSKEVIVS